MKPAWCHLFKSLYLWPSKASSFLLSIIISLKKACLDKPIGKSYRAEGELMPTPWARLLTLLTASYASAVGPFPASFTASANINNTSEYRINLSLMGLVVGLEAPLKNPGLMDIYLDTWCPLGE